MDFPPSVQITGDLSAGKCKNGMMAGRLGHADGAERHRDYATDTAVRFSPVREEDGGVGGGEQRKKKCILCKQEQMTPSQLQLSGARQSNRSLRQQSDQLPLSAYLSFFPPSSLSFALFLYFIAKSFSFVFFFFFSHFSFSLCSFPSFSTEHFS